MESYNLTWRYKSVQRNNVEVTTEDQGIIQMGFTQDNIGSIDLLLLSYEINWDVINPKHSINPKITSTSSYSYTNVLRRRDLIKIWTV